MARTGAAPGGSSWYSEGSVIHAPGLDVVSLARESRAGKREPPPREEHAGQIGRHRVVSLLRGSFSHRSTPPNAPLPRGGEYKARAFIIVQGRR